MTVNDICSALGGELQSAGDGGREVTGATAGDLLSFIMGNAREGCVWVTIQAHLNVAAVAVLKDLPLIILASGRKAPEDLVDRCTAEKIALLSVPESLYEVCGNLSALGVKG